MVVIRGASPQGPKLRFISSHSYLLPRSGVKPRDHLQHQQSSDFVSMAARGDLGWGSSAEPRYGKRPTLPYRVLRPWHLSMFSWENFICFFVPANYPMSHSNPSTIKLFSWIKSITNLFSSQCSINFYMCIKPFTLNILAKRNLQYIYILMRTRWWDFILFQFCR
jgi:hypothetical protein